MKPESNNEQTEVVEKIDKALIKSIICEKNHRYILTSKDKREAVCEVCGHGFYFNIAELLQKFKIKKVRDTLYLEEI